MDGGSTSDVPCVGGVGPGGPGGAYLVVLGWAVLWGEAAAMLTCLQVFPASDVMNMLTLLVDSSAPMEPREGGKARRGGGGGKRGGGRGKRGGGGKDSWRGKQIFT